ncbi:3-oxoacyl-ACP reductase [Mycolicibacterium chitae]|uniref:3-oxoacyl-[acyl-carrier-protein] reductase MabA n=1 Tax=Mycolicibacterium chitae TaxID=1792 RepID=A0A448I3A0_MYCCI|nr:SDR family oxidoreductase [Mycolicibacterium chitae]MCV7104801.1 SDR family oxidoreductase [Mycolicibacterium chitae]BBZ03338.1 3-oxoacyl-ACP reductase [Mycolicibacterium chitae]VEG46780.1 short-chain dehydrogenase [Mycolicibacterium chitae]
MDLGIAGRTALVFGAGGGLGGAIAAALAQEGVRVALADIDAAALSETEGRLRDRGAETYCVQWDLADVAGAADRIAQVRSELGEVDILVNNTGGPPPSPVAGQPADTWESHFRSMVLAVIGVTDLVLPGMTQRGWGRVITSTSSGVIAPIPNLGLSNTLRSALVGWSKTLASEVGGAGVTSNIVLPGRIATDRIRFLDEKRAEREGLELEEVVRQSTSSIPLGRYGEPREYGDVVAFLASERASYLTGSVFRIDGGYINAV